MGFCYGGMVATYAAALDSRIKAVASFCGWTPMRSDTSDKRGGGLIQYSALHAIAPKLGLFLGHEKDIPFDYDLLLEMITPRPCLVYAPTRDRFADVNDIRNCVDSVRQSSDAAITLLTPDDICRFQKDQQNILLEWLQKLP